MPLFSEDAENVLVYLTNGVSKDGDVEVRKKRLGEAVVNLTRALTDFRLRIVHVGDVLDIREGVLHENLSKVVKSKILDREFKKALYGSLIITSTFEGAHQDHDAACVIARTYAEKYNLKSLEASTYPQLFKKVYSFSVMRPEDRDFEIKFQRLQIAKIATRLMWGYKSQRRTWVGLGLHTLFIYCFSKFYTAKKAEVRKVAKCFYEFRGRAKQDEVFSFISEFRSLESPSHGN